MEAAELLVAMQEQAVKDGKTLVKNQIELAYDPAVELAATKVKAAIPGQVDDVIIDMVVKSAAPILKAELLAAIEKV